MNFSFKNAMVLASFSVLLYSCNEPILQETGLETEKIDTLSNRLRKNAELDKLYDSKSQFKREFAYALAAAMSESESFRTLIKSKVLERFDDDDEVLYSALRDEKIADGLTVEQLVSKFIGNKKIFSELEKTSPTLTISVPDLPNNVFNATIWNTSTQVPSVAIRLENTNDIPIIGSDGSENIMEAKDIPGFPVIVLKENERVIAESDQSFKTKKAREFKDKRGNKYKFVSDNFDFKNKQNLRLYTSSNIDYKVRDAYNAYPPNSTGWQRDYIYYNISPNQDRGAFDNSFEEAITSFQMIGDPWAAYYKIADQSDDPRSENYRGHSSQPHWSDGAFEFKITALINSQNGTGPTKEIYFSVSPSQLFDLHYRQASHNWFGADKYELDNVTFPSSPVNLNLPIMKWDLQNYSVAMKLSFEEVDLIGTQTEGSSHTSKFAANFEINAQLTKKIGAKFGASWATEKTQTYSKVINFANDKLGDVFVEFGDNVITSYSGGVPVLVKDYYLGSYAMFNVIPRRVN